jgi:hypothetical protein
MNTTTVATDFPSTFNTVASAFKDVLLIPTIIFCIAVAVGILVVINAIRFEKGFNLKTILLIICLLLEGLMFIIFYGNPFLAIIGLVLVYLLNSMAFLVYGFIRSKQIYNSMISSNTITHSYNTIFWISVILLFGGEILIFVFAALEANITHNLVWISQLMVFLGFCFWMHFLNMMRKTAASPRVIRRMFWSALGVILLAILGSIASAVAIFISIQSLVQAFSSGSVQSVENAIQLVKNTLIIVLTVITFFFSANHLCYVTMCGYTIWDVCYLTRDKWEKDHDAYHGSSPRSNVQMSNYA